TFTMPQPPLLVRLPLLLFAGIASVLASIAVAVIGAIRNRRGAQTGDPIIARYEPPEEVSAAIASQLIREPKRAMTATLLDLAVRRRIRLLYDEPADMYGAQALSDEGLRPDEKDVYQRIFGAITSGIPFIGTVE